MLGGSIPTRFMLRLGARLACGRGMFGLLNKARVNYFFS